MFTDNMIVGDFDSNVSRPPGLPFGSNGGTDIYMSGITANNASKAFPNFESDVSKLRRDD